MLSLITALVDRATQDNKQVSGFYIRKSRKKYGYYGQFEGEINNLPIVFVDDVINSGFTALWAQAVLKEQGYRINTVVALKTWSWFCKHSHGSVNSHRSVNTCTVSEYRHN